MSAQEDDLHGTLVADPFRWLEDTHSAETREWIEAQNRLSHRYLDAIPGRDAIKERLTRLWDYEKFSVPFTEGGRTFFFRNSGLQNQSVLYVADSRDAEPRILLDPNTLSADGTVSVSGASVSRDGQFLAYSLSVAGSDWLEWHVWTSESERLSSGRNPVLEVLRATWTHDNKGFFYSRYAEPGEDAELEQRNFGHEL